MLDSVKRTSLHLFSLPFTPSDENGILLWCGVLESILITFVHGRCNRLSRRADNLDADWPLDHTMHY